MYKKITNLRDNLAEAWSVYTAHHNNIFENLNEHKPTFVNEICKKFGWDEVALESLLNALTASGYLIKRNNGFLLSNTTKKYLIKKSDTYMGDMMHILNMYKNFEFYQKRLEGQTLKVDSQLWEDITAATSRIAKPAIETLLTIHPKLKKEKATILDVGCGRADYLILLAENNLKLKGVGIDFDDKVIHAAKYAVTKVNLSNRISLIKGDFINFDLNEKVDAVMFNNIFHLVGEKVSTNLIQKAYNLLKQGGVIFVLELCKNDKVAVVFPQYFDMAMRLYFKEGKCFTLSELKDLLKGGGFRNLSARLIQTDTSNVWYVFGKK